MSLSISELKTKVLNFSDTSDFNDLALKIFQFQYNHNKTYRSFVDFLKINPNKIIHYTQIPFLPIEFFKTQIINIEGIQPKTTFESSGTTGKNSSKHRIEDLEFYKLISSKIFEFQFGNIENKIILGLLPSYLERKGSSLVFMVNHFMEISKNSDSGFYLNDFEQLHKKLNELKNTSTEVVLFGVTFALLDFCKYFSIDFPTLTIIETGGMKGKGKELIRDELHFKLKNGFGVSNIFSEYGMTELLSQGYSSDKSGFVSPPWMKILVREINDPFCVNEIGKGIINVIDLANIESCCFIATDDIGRVFENRKFDVEGRIDYSDLRGCSLLSV